MAKALTRPPKSETDDPLKLAPAAPHQVAETTRLFRLSPVGNDLSIPHRHIALVAAESEDQARELACSYDPFGRDWKNTNLFAADSFEDTSSHVVGDVIFKSIPLPKP